jgi:hypothetical protein
MVKTIAAEKRNDTASSQKQARSPILPMRGAARNGARMDVI